MEASTPVTKEKDVEKMLKLSAALEEKSVSDCNRWALECAQNADSQSKQIFEELVADEERHYAQYDTELDNMARFGKNYLAFQSIERAKPRGSQAPAE